MSSRSRGLERLRALKHQASITAAQQSAHRERFQRLGADESKPRAVSSFNLFQTPPDVARQLLRGLDLDGAKVLEPSAGLGRIYRAIRNESTTAEIQLIDFAHACTEELTRATEGDTLASVRTADFLEVEPTGDFDYVIMNPPFKRGTDVKHIDHALAFLKPGGILRALCFNGATQNKKLRPRVDSWRVLPADSFKSEGTRASVAVVEVCR